MGISGQTSLTFSKQLIRTVQDSSLINRIRSTSKITMRNKSQFLQSLPYRFRYWALSLIFALSVEALPNQFHSVHEPQEPIVLSVYYETLCQDSIKFLENQLLPLLKNMEEQIMEQDKSPSTMELVPARNDIDIQLIPYGKAMTLLSTEVSKPNFLCQHGPLECSGNKLHACFLNLISEMKETVRVSYYQQTRFLLCTMKHILAISSSPAELLKGNSAYKNANSVVVIQAALDTCLQEELFPSSNTTRQLRLKARVEECIGESGEGSFLLKQNGELTSRLDPKLYFVPWILFNGKWSKEMMDDGLKDIKKPLCFFLTKNALKLSDLLECQRYVNSNIKQNDTPNSTQSKLNLRKPKRLAESSVRRMRFKGARAFLHRNNDMLSENGGKGAGWRWRTNIHQSKGNEWNWRKQVVGRK